MTLADLVRSAVAIANNVSATLQDEVFHEAYVGRDQYGNPQYGPVVTRKAIVERKQRQVRTLQGQEAVSSSKISFLEPVVVGEFDRLVLSDGTYGPILNIEGLMDPDVNRTYYVVVYLG